MVPPPPPPPPPSSQATAAAPAVASPQPLSVLVIGANGYFGSAICSAFLRASTPSHFFRVYGLVRREATARCLALAEVMPIVGSLSERDALAAKVQSRSKTWDVIVTCTEPSRADEAQHWDDLVALIQELAKASASLGVKPLVLASSGCKDYGMTGLDGAKDLAPHTESSPLQTHPLITGRMGAALRALAVAASTGNFDAAVVRATPVFGYSGSYYGAAFEYAAAFASAPGAEKRTLDFTTDRGTIMHGLHIDDCGEGYVALATTYLWGGEEGRRAVAGEVFNLSGRRYETLEEVGAALAREYGFGSGARFGVAAAELPPSVSDRNCDLVFGWSQWVSSDKIRRVTGWTDKRPLFADNIGTYRVAFEAAAQAGADDVEKARRRMAGNWGDDYLVAAP
ncbi:hypothetical protein QBC42DRAFT_216738 [Cladorrhinum samala]|uniref:NAD-dependent epimerase/dehydratase domain-containing protein n=1 Tax=Cladorrhinum samala TaxID=585594 RepID=A0AAV9I3W0_9PEZI|nr:hypothetical protein QBC42DRAFT_216738 [Cladorrhinum samala]